MTMAGIYLNLFAVVLGTGYLASGWNHMSVGVRWLTAVLVVLNSLVVISHLVRG
jgi:tellurite resistance protein TehA-like permease